MTELAAVEARDDWPSRWFANWPWPRWMDARWPDLGPGLGSELRVEEYRDGKDLVVRAEMPGIDPDKDVEIQVTDHLLTLRVQRKQESKVGDKDTYRSEFHYGSFARSVRLPSGATEEDVKASYRDGILEVRIPVDDAKAQQTKIPVQRA